MSHPLDVKLDHRKWGTSPATTRAEYETMIEVEGAVEVVVEVERTCVSY